MTIIEIKTPREYDPNVVEICGELCGQKPVDVPVKVEAYARDAQCFRNVLEKVEQDGGSSAYGWFITVMPELYFNANFHAVWRAPDGRLVDITPPQAATPHG